MKRGQPEGFVCSEVTKWTQRFQKQLAVFDVGVAKLRRNQKPYADLVILREPEGRVEVLRRKQGAYSGIKAVCILICIGRDAPFGAKPPIGGIY